MEQEQVEADLRAAFDKMDVRGVGKITAEDLKKAMAAQVEVLTDDEVQEMMEEADVKRTGGWTRRICGPQRPSAALSGMPSQRAPRSAHLRPLDALTEARRLGSALTLPALAALQARLISRASRP